MVRKSSSMSTYGTAGVPAWQFDVRLRFGFFFTVAVWENSALLHSAVGEPITRRWEAVCVDFDKPSKRVCVMHLTIKVTPDVIVHELSHVMRLFEKKVRRRFRSDFSLCEAIAREDQSSYTAILSHMAEERRLMEIFDH